MSKFIIELLFAFTIAFGITGCAHFNPCGSFGCNHSGQPITIRAI